MILRRLFVYFVGCFLPVLTVLHLSLAALLCYVPQRFPLLCNDHFFSEVHPVLLWLAPFSTRRGLEHIAQEMVPL